MVPRPDLAFYPTLSGLGERGWATPGRGAGTYSAEGLSARPKPGRGRVLAPILRVGEGGSQEGWRVSPRPHPEPGGGGIVEAQGRGRGAPQARDGRGAVAEREAEAEWAQSSGEGGEEDAAAAGSAAGTGRSVSGAWRSGRGEAAPPGLGFPCPLTCRPAAAGAAGSPPGPQASCPPPTLARSSPTPELLRVQRVWPAPACQARASQ